jgi:hypothetical protein
VAERWAEAAEQADTAAAAQPASDLEPGVERQRRTPAHSEQTDSSTVEPTPTGYRHMGRMFRDELDRVQRLRRRVGQLAHAIDGETTDEQGESS